MALERLTGALSRFVGWHREQALPLWAGAAWDEARGGFYEALDFAGAPLEGPRRVRVQSRQIHAFLEAAQSGWAPGGEALARKGFEYSLANACPDGGARGCIHALAADGAVIDARRDLYDQAFLLLACSSVWRALKDRRALDLAGATLAFLDADLASPAGGYLEDDRGARPRRQNPHMHLFEALLALYEATGDEAWLVRADAIFDLFRRCFFLRGEGRLVEFFTDALAPEPGEKGLIVEPGHMAEWVWLLDTYGAARGIDLGAMQRELFDGARRLGADPASAFLIDSLAVGDPSPDRARRLWPQTEYLRASLVMARHGDIEAQTVAAGLIDALFDTYLDQPVAGLWCDRYDGAGRPIANDVPASILYHLLSAALEAQRFLDEKAA
ncbi:MAG: AGE family epimerase/isomerase [Amphiplicatus sp.]